MLDVKSKTEQVTRFFIPDLPVEINGSTVYKLKFVIACALGERRCTKKAYDRFFKERPDGINGSVTLLYDEQGLVCDYTISAPPGGVILTRHNSFFYSSLPKSKTDKPEADNTTRNNKRIITLE